MLMQRPFGWKSPTEKQFILDKMQPLHYLPMLLQYAREQFSNINIGDVQQESTSMDRRKWNSQHNKHHCGFLVVTIFGHGEGWH